MAARRKGRAAIFISSHRQYSDLIELDAGDLRRDPLEVRKAVLADVIARAAPGIRLNEHLEEDGPIVFRHACKLGLKGIVSKCKHSSYRSGRSPDWIKSKNPACAAVVREAEEDLGALARVDTPFMKSMRHASLA